MNRFAMFLSTVLPLVMAAEIGAQAPTAVCVQVHKLAIGRFFSSNGGDGTLTVVKAIFKGESPKWHGSNLSLRPHLYSH